VPRQKSGCGKREALALREYGCDKLFFVLRQTGAKHIPAFLEKGWGGGCEETDFIRREELLCNVKSLPLANVKRSLARVWM